MDLPVPDASQEHLGSVAVHIAKSHVVVTMCLKSGYLTTGAATRLLRAFELCRRCQKRIVLLRISGADAAMTNWDLTVQAQISQSLEKFGFGVGDPASDFVADFPLPLKLVCALSEGRIPVVALVSGTLVNAGFSLLAWCDTILVDAGFCIEVSADSFLEKLQPLPTGKAPVEKAVALLTARSTLVAPEAQKCGFVHAVISIKDEFRKVESRLEASLRPRGADVWAIVRDVARLAGMSKDADVDGSEGRENGNTEITTLIIRNIPKFFTSKKLADLICQVGFEGKFDFVYVPSAGNRYKSVDGTLGYGFVNFLDPADAEAFTEVFDLYHIEGARNPCNVQASKSQGRSKILKMMKKARSLFVDPSHHPVLPAVGCGLATPV